jgi:hypothetical protein
MMDDLEHLLPEHRPEAMRSNEERIRSIRVDRWIGYARADAILVRMRELVTYPPHDRMPALLLFGATGMGKTKILRKFLRDHPPSFDNRSGITRMQLVSIDDGLVSHLAALVGGKTVRQRLSPTSSTDTASAKP